MHHPLIILIISLCLSLSSAQANNQICSSSCASWISACYNITYNGCIVCDNSLFEMSPNPTTGCIPKPQVSIQSVDLKNPIDLTSFETTTDSTFTCSGFQIAGKYTNGDKISKLYLISNPHYWMRIRFSIVFIGTFSTNDQIFVWIDNIKYAYNYSCINIGAYCSVKDCIRTIDQDFDHNGRSVQIEINGTTTAGTSWGIKDLIVASYLCHPTCQQCYGGSQTECLFCADGYYLEGNLCVRSCSNYTMQSSKFCTTLCPNGFYPTLNKTCDICYEGCQMCTGPTLDQCLMKNVAGPSFYKNIGFNVLLIMTGVALVCIGIYCFIKRCYGKKQVEIHQISNDLGKKMVNETSEGFIEDNMFNNSMHDKSRDGLVYEKGDPRDRKVSMLEEIQL